MHFHYVLSMGAVFALYSAWYFWIPKILGVDYNKSLSKTHFWTLFAGVNITFFPQHFLGLQGMPRRISDYPDAFAGWNMISSLGSLISVVATWLFLHILHIQLVEGKATSRYLWLTPLFYYDLLQTLLNRGFNSLEWGLSSPPKPHAYTSLPLQSASLIEYIVKMLKKTWIIFSFCLFMYLSYRLPGRFIFEILNIVWLYPVYNAIISCLGVVIISGLCNKQIKPVRVAIVGICSLMIGIFVLYIHENQDVLMYAYDHLTILLPLVSAILLDRGTIPLSFASKEDSPAGPSTSTTGGPSSSATGGASSSTTGGPSSSTTGGASAEGSGIGTDGSRIPKDPDIRPLLEGSLKALALDPNQLLTILTGMSFLKGTGYALPDEAQAGLTMLVEKNLPKPTVIPASVRPSARPYWTWKQIYDRALLNMKVAELAEGCLKEDAVEARKAAEEYTVQVTRFRNEAFYRMANMFDTLNHQDRKTIKKHMPDHITKESFSDVEDYSTTDSDSE